MNDITHQAIGSPLLDHCPESLPANWYFDASHHEREMKAIWATGWMYAGRANDIAPMTVKRIDVAGQNLILVKDADGAVNCFHNTCRHRGAELCAEAETRLKARLIACPYHAWAYDLSGHLVRTPFVADMDDFRKADHGLFKVRSHVWNGFVFVCLSEAPPDFAAVPDLGLHALDNWPMADLATGHVLVKEIACNWKIFWENYNVYGRGYMSASEEPGYDPVEAGGVLEEGALTWTMTGKPCGPEFSRLTQDERARGHTFVTLMPGMFIVAHVDYVRAVSLKPLGPERIELRAEWLFSEATLDAPGFDLDNVTRFATTVMLQDGAACEMNQRGLKSSAFKMGRLMPQEFDVHHFQQWIRRRLNG
jgi:glycine betaine catabolism A